MIPELRGWNYRTDGRLGGGGYAQVYQSRHPDYPGKVYAIKVFNEPLYANTFEQEVQILQALQACPHTPALIDFGRDSTGKLCIVAEMAPGMRLDRWIRHYGPLSATQVEVMLAQVLTVLDFAHQRDILHKDIKASNILIDEETFTVLDWGVAQFRNGGRQETIRAKQEYVAPECYWGRQEFATDFYSLGWLVIQAISGVLPYQFAIERDPDYRAAAHCLERPQFPDNLEGSLRDLVARWLCKDSSQRLCGYHLPTLLAQSKSIHCDFSTFLDYRQIRHEGNFLHRTARHGVPYAQYTLALRLLSKKRPREAHYWLEQAAGQKFARAQYRLSKLVATTDPKRAADLLEQAAVAGHASARHRLGNALLCSEDNPLEIPRGLALLRLAADSGHGPSNALLAKWLAPSPEYSEEFQLRLQRAKDRGHLPDIPEAISELKIIGPSEMLADQENTVVLAQSTCSVHEEEGLTVIEAVEPCELDVHARAWDRLIIESPYAYPTQSYGWLRAFYRYKLRRTERMRCLFIYQNRKLTGVLPLLGGCRVHGLGRADHHYQLPFHDYHTIRVDLLTNADPAAILQVCFDHLSRTSPATPVIRWRKVPATSPIFAAVTGGNRSLGVLYRQSGLEHRIGLPTEFLTYWAALKGKFRRELHRQERRLLGRTPISYRLREVSRSVEDNLARFVEVEQSGWKGRRRTSIRDLSGDPPLFLAAARQFAANGWLEWNFLEADDRDIAAQFAVRLNRTLYMWKIGYREDFANCAPSHLLFLRTVENACAQGDVDTINFMAQRRWLKVWKVEEHPLYNMIVFPFEPLPARLIEAAQGENYVWLNSVEPLIQSLPVLMETSDGQA